MFPAHEIRASRVSAQHGLCVSSWRGAPQGASRIVRLVLIHRLPHSPARLDAITRMADLHGVM